MQINAFISASVKFKYWGKNKFLFTTEKCSFVAFIEIVS